MCARLGTDSHIHAGRHYSATELTALIFIQSLGASDRAAEQRLCGSMWHGSSSRTSAPLAWWRDVCGERSSATPRNCRRLVGPFCGMESMGGGIERVPRGNLRVPLVDFARVWVAAERRADELKAAGQGDWYLV